VHVVVSEHRLQRVRCPDCGRRARGELPDGVATSAFGPRFLRGACGALGAQPDLATRRRRVLRAGCSSGPVSESRSFGWSFRARDEQVEYPGRVIAQLASVRSEESSGLLAHVADPVGGDDLVTRLRHTMQFGVRTTGLQSANLSECAEEFKSSAEPHDVLGIAHVYMRAQPTATQRSRRSLFSFSVAGSTVTSPSWSVKCESHRSGVISLPRPRDGHSASPGTIVAVGAEVATGWRAPAGRRPCGQPPSIAIQPSLTTVTSTPRSSHRPRRARPQERVRMSAGRASGYLSKAPSKAASHASVALLSESLRRHNCSES